MTFSLRILPKSHDAYLLVIAPDLFNLASERLYPPLGHSVLVQCHLQLPLHFIVVGLDLSELQVVKGHKLI